MRYRLRTLLIVSALGLPVLAGAWSYACAWSDADSDLLVSGLIIWAIVAVCLGVWITSGIAPQRQN
ncbi:MAG TPA: hypothetical protein VFB80_09085 [Pirellulaceae bacterium]|nr:hypothetical protein [Pirellulaceae bacterium]